MVSVGVRMRQPEQLILVPPLKVRMFDTPQSGEGSVAPVEEAMMAGGEATTVAVTVSEGVKAHARSAGLLAKECLRLAAVLVAQDEMG